MLEPVVGNPLCLYSIRDASLVTIPGTSTDDTWEQSDIVLAVGCVLNRNQVPIARKDTEREEGLPSIR